MEKIKAKIREDMFVSVVINFIRSKGMKNPNKRLIVKLREFVRYLDILGITHFSYEEYVERVYRVMDLKNFRWQYVHKVASLKFAIPYSNFIGVTSICINGVEHTESEITFEDLEEINKKNLRGWKELIIQRFFNV